MAITLGAVTLNVTEIIPVRTKKMVHHQIPERYGDRLQNMGFVSRMWEIKSELIGTNKDTEKATLQGYYDDDDSVTLVYEGDSYTVKLEKFIVTQNASDSMWNTRIDVVEVD